ncbi:HIRAN domain-containing protein [Rhodohalobacter mucosus]|uniref:HIRAN domain-containing protein n=1 Tax=Rhodohalobacter mucosus TaxID=2079485 RepID=A0A316TM30_9BACT|nr:HIRAN domain-containing protein [Rhodohalobacter mucosus]PWN05637.1 hypothetical protein DDZ15_13650 [Rhodohalobacter mucosus]
MDTVSTIFIVLIVLYLLMVFLFPKKSPEEKKKYYDESKSKKFYECSVAGVPHHSGKVRPGDYVELFHDPGNEYDKNAIEVRNLKGKMVGYIPKDENKKVLKVLEKEELFAKVLSVYKRHTEVFIEIRQVVQ